MPLAPYQVADTSARPYDPDRAVHKYELTVGEFSKVKDGIFYGIPQRRNLLQKTAFLFSGK